MNGLNKMTNKAIFLDIDGVLNTTATRAATRCRFHDVFQNHNRPLEKSDIDFHEPSVTRFINLVNKHEANIVITSMWRFASKIEWFQELFALYGLDLDISRLDTIITCDYEVVDGQRSEFVEDYLKDKPYDSFVCIDDTRQHYNRLLDKFVLTDITYGFTDIDFYKADAILSRT